MGAVAFSSPIIERDPKLTQRFADQRRVRTAIDHIGQHYPEVSSRLVERLPSV